MRTIFYIIQKEFLQIFRDKMMLPIIFAIPIVQLLVLSYTATFEIKHIEIGIADLDRSVLSQDLISRFNASPFYEVKQIETSYKALEQELQSGHIAQILYIPAEFEKDILLRQNSSLQIVTDAINGSAASLMSAYTTQIIAGFNKDYLVKNQLSPANYKQISSHVSYWYNPELDYKTFMVPGILVLLVTIIGLFLSSMNIVREKELGTIEQLNVTPIRKYQFIVGKLMPFWFIAMFDLILGLLIGRFVFVIPIVGSVPMVLAVAGIYLILILGIGLFISTMADTQQQSMFISWFFVMIFILLSGLFTPTESMPEWAQALNLVNPIAYFISFMRLVILKGSGFSDLFTQISSIALYAFVVISLATWRYRKSQA
jgi:ABC-2 type transport system permease protein